MHERAPLSELAERLLGNRQASKDRLAASLDYETNLRAELDILRLHEKLDRLAALEAKLDALAGRQEGTA